jgi:hypothetical protein
VVVNKVVPVARISYIESYTITEAHKMFGHCDEESSRAIAKQIGWHITRSTILPCERCARGKAKQTVVARKESEYVKVLKEINGHKASYLNMRLMFD